jgi:periplasmic divalent cation tolerance protein
MNSKKCCVVMTTTDSRDVAKLIAQGLVTNKLAACVQIDKVNSFFFWEGRAQEGEEFRLTIKALTDNYADIEKFILGNHNYQLPQIIKLDITDGLPAYLDWVEATSCR